jgi:hypothetical protein
MFALSIETFIYYLVVTQKMGITRLESLPVMQSAVFELAEITFKSNAVVSEVKDGSSAFTQRVKGLASRYPADDDKSIKLLVYVLGIPLDKKDYLAYRLGVPLDMNNLDINNTGAGYFVTRKEDVEDYRALTQAFGRIYIFSLIILSEWQDSYLPSLYVSCFRLK